MRTGTTAISADKADLTTVTSVGILRTSRPSTTHASTFGVALAKALADRGASVKAVWATEASEPDDSDMSTSMGAPRLPVAAAVAALNRCDVAVVQREAPSATSSSDGAELVDVLRRLKVPSIAIAYSGATDPAVPHLALMAEIASAADRVVVMSEAARAQLGRQCGIDLAKVTVIPYGATMPIVSSRSDRGSRPMLLTWGHLRPGKGIERMIGAMQLLEDCGLSRRPRYVVAGPTHPDELAANGERYRNTCIAETWRAGVAPSVTFDSQFRSDGDLFALVQSAAAVVLPYDSTVQAASRVLVEAVAAGRPVVATAFPHALEQLSSGAGIVVDHDNPDALGDALRMVISEPDVAANMATESMRLAPRFDWPVIADAYLEVAGSLVAERRQSS